jgi:hypothetical protein
MVRFRLLFTILTIVSVYYNVKSQPAPADESISTSIINTCPDTNYKSELIFTLNKSHFYLQEPIIFSMTFHNIGIKPDTLWGMLRIINTQAANPPYIWLRSGSLKINELLRGIGIPEHLMDSNDIIVLPGDSVVLMQFNLDAAFTFQEGSYYIQGGYNPLPRQCLGGHIGSYIRDSLVFVVGLPSSVVDPPMKHGIRSNGIALKSLAGSIELSFNSSSKNYRLLKVFDLTGRMILEKRLKIGLRSQLIENLPKGMFIFNLFATDNNIQQIKYLHY